MKIAAKKAIKILQRKIDFTIKGSFLNDVQLLVSVTKSHKMDFLYDFFIDI